ncbi:DUF6114 domain-containing protein [Aquibacillus sp. 3ASR75-11]|uniref:DUF6114 domain-containing protein n=1 Tax=Terrihalobacillus insolitus TaxID=2950438 RepID=A0A9X3WTP0_9BACI|nr:DUF6114 domain-containing protein [Terrihalobacillus insolitus]MDC3414566.1 DUF6114 domain-containing protein [Terrihalobacillus insolitus]MDC3425757.1 DUF6114 domain-containing protein [Terrihalobacillus insolitus]
MNKKEARALKKEEKILKKYRKISNAGRFTQWRNQRPFLGGILTLLAGFMILYIPLQLYSIAFVPGSFAFIGFLFGGLIVIMGVLNFIYPAFSTVFGVITIFLSVLSVMGALGGFLIGTILGIIGGSLSIGWEHKELTMMDSKRDDEVEVVQT